MNHFINKIAALISLFFISNTVFAVDIKVAFIVDNKVLVKDPEARTVIESWIPQLNQYYSSSGVNIRVESADIRFMDVGSNTDSEIIDRMHDARMAFSDIRSYTDRKGADFTITVIDDLRNDDGEETGGLAFINAEYDDDLGADLMLDFINYCNEHGMAGCQSASSLWSKFKRETKRAFKQGVTLTTRIINYTADITPFSDYSVTFLQHLGEQLCDAVQDSSHCRVAINNLSDHKYFVGAVKFDGGSMTVAHELGHTMGLIHGEHVIRVCKDVQNVFDFRGYGISKYAGGFAVGNCDDTSTEAEGGDIMADSYVDGSTSPIFSSPNYNANCLVNGGICGNASNADATRALNENLRYYDKQDTDVAELSYPDINLKNCLMSKYLDNEVKGFKTLACSSVDISNLKGIEKLTDLTTIDLSFNKLVDVKELLQLNPTVIQSLYLKGNNSMLCHQSAQLKAIFSSKVVLPDSCFNIGVMIAINSLLLQ
jgi:hypothetical protein